MEWYEQVVGWLKQKKNVIVLLDTFSIQRYPQVYAIETGRYLEIMSFPNEINTCRICTTIVSCGGGELVSGATGGATDGEFG